MTIKYNMTRIYKLIVVNSILLSIVLLLITAHIMRLGRMSSFAFGIGIGGIIYGIKEIIYYVILFSRNSPAISLEGGGLKIYDISGDKNIKVDEISHVEPKTYYMIKFFQKRFLIIYLKSNKKYSIRVDILQDEGLFIREVESHVAK